jgi:RNA ligase (TIGR02306 family)
VHIQGVKRSTFPVHLLPKADETRVQVLGGLVERFKGTVFNKTEKLDGSSFTAIMNVDDFMICSRNQLLDPADLSHTFCALAKRIGLESKMRALQERGSFAIQGEVVGPSIQKNKYKLAEHELYVFDIYRIPYEMYVEPEEMREFAMRVGLKTVPNLGDFILDHSIDDLVALSSGASALNLMTEREGIVLRPAHGTPTDSKGNRVSMKVINPKFLLKFDE